MAKFRKKPVVIEAVQWTGANLEELLAFVPSEFRHNKIHQPMGIVTLEGAMTISEGDWIIKGVRGEFYPCKPDIFEATYEEVHEPGISDGHPDGNVHTVPNQGQEHRETPLCWCGPTLADDFTNQGGVKHYLHREIQ